jgi:hypothetical protein
LVLSLLLRLFGTGAGGARAIQILGSSAAALGFALLPALALAGELGLSTGVMAGLAGALLPINFWAQTKGTFEAPYTSVALVTLCLLVCRVWTRDRFAKSEASVLGAVAGFGCLLTPSLIPVLAAWSMVAIASYRRRLRRVVPFIGVAIAVIVSILAPWAIRNYNALGAFIWTRSNFGLELQISNNDVMTADGEHNVRMPEFAMLHPFASASELVKVREMGEVAYERSKERQAFAWIASHKLRFLSLTAERFRLFWLPNMRRPWQSTMEAVLTFSGMGGLVALWWKKRWFTWVVMPVFVGYSAVYYVIEASGRYRYPLEPILFLLAASLVAGIIRHIVAAVSSFNRRRDIAATSAHPHAERVSQAFPPR